MFATDITLAGDASSSQTYSLQSIANGKAVRGDVATGPALPRSLTISHTEASKAGKVTDRHLVRFDLVKEDSTTKEKATGAIYVVIEMPREIITVAQLKDMATQLKNFLTAGNIDKLLNNEP